MKNFYLVCLTVLSFGLAADVSPERLSQIDSNVGSMSLEELRDRRSFLVNEQAYLQDTQDSTQNPSTVKSNSGRLAEIAAELSAIQKALIAMVGAVAINNLSSDGYDRSIPPVITINGANPATVELGSTYSDAGASSASSRGTVYQSRPQVL